MASPFDWAKNYMNSADPLDKTGPEGLRGLLKAYLRPELTRMQEQRGPIESAFFGQALEPGALYGAASTAAQGAANELFKPGGQIASLIGKARGQTIGQGFAPEAALGRETGILQQGADTVANVFASEASNLEQLRFGALAQFLQGREQSITDLLTSLYTGAAGAEQLKLANKRQKFLGIF